MLYEEIFGPLGQIILIGIGAGILIFTCLILLCYFQPGCLVYKCRHRRTKTDDKSTPVQYNGQSNDNIKLGDVSYRSWRLGSLYENGSICEVPESQRGSYNSTNAHVEAAETTSTVNLIKAEKQKSENRTKDFPTEITMSLQYLPPMDNNISGKLVIGIEAVSDLPPKQYNCTLEPYVALTIVKQTWTNRKRIKLHSFRTRGVRHTASPIYRETFVVADVSFQEVKDWVLEFAAYDHDRYANHTELANARVPVKEVKKILYSPEIHLFNYKMKQSRKEFGYILLGINYLPTAQRLTINIAKLRDLKFELAVRSVEEFNPYVRVLMLNGKTGRKLKKQKTKFIRATAHPEFNETLIFDVSNHLLDTVQFLVVLCSKAHIEEMVNGDHPSDSEDSVRSYKKSRDVYIGKVALGKGVRGSEERLHWFSVLQNPRKVVTVWHTFK